MNSRKKKNGRQAAASHNRRKRDAAEPRAQTANGDKPAAAANPDLFSVFEKLFLFGEGALTATVFRTKNRTLASKAVELLTAEKPMTLRQLYYRLISAGALNNKQSEDPRLGAVMSRIREAGDVPRTWLVDHTRTTFKPSSWSGLSDFADSVRNCYRKDYWESLPHHVELFVEKDAVAGTIQPVTHENDIALRVCRGYSSISFAGEIADEWEEIEKPIYAYYLGDFDPSGFDLERDLREKLSRYSGLTYYEYGDAVAGSAFAWRRLGVRQEDFDELDLIRLPVKKSDNRAKGFIATWGEDCAEIDAIPPSELRRRVKEAIEEHIDVDRWNRLITVEQAEQETLNRFVEGMGQEKVKLDSVSDEASE